jgi:hypothetical protein
MQSHLAVCSLHLEPNGQSLVSSHIVSLDSGSALFDPAFENKGVLLSPRFPRAPLK